MRKMTKKIKVGNIFIGGDSPITVQSMTNTKTADAYKTIEQIKAFEQAGCDIARVAVSDEDAARAIEQIKRVHLFRLVLKNYLVRVICYSCRWERVFQ